jgi:hypothetical protein
MNVRFLHYAAALFFLPPVLIAEEEVTIKHVLSPAGVEQTLTAESVSTMKFVYKTKGAPDQEVNQHNSHTQKCIATVMAIDGENITKLQVKYEYARDKRNDDTPQETAISGKTYIAELVNSKAVIKGIDGSEISRDEQNLLTGDTERTMKPGKFIKFMDGQKLRVGRALEVPAEIVREMLNMPAEAKLDKFSMTLASVKPIDGIRCACFEIEFGATTASPGHTAETVMNGEMVLSLDNCWPISMGFAGPITLKGTQPQGSEKSFSATGRYEWKTRASYQFKP